MSSFGEQGAASGGERGGHLVGAPAPGSVPLADVALESGVGAHQPPMVVVVGGGALMEGFRVGAEADPPAGARRAPLPVSLLGVEEESFVEAAERYEGRAPHQQDRRDDEVPMPVEARQPRAPGAMPRAGSGTANTPAMRLESPAGAGPARHSTARLTRRARARAARPPRARIPSMHGFVAQAQPVHRAGAEVLEQHVHAID